MRFCLMSEPQQGMSYEEILDLARAVEQSGLEAYFRSDHYSSFPGGAGQPTTDAWATLAGLARETRRINLGVLVSPVTFRLPGNLAKVVTTVAEMSGGRVEIGMGAGWNEQEHRQHGLRFPSPRERYDMLEEQLAIIHGLWTEPDGWSFEGSHWQLEDALFHPKPPARDGRRHPNILLGGDGGPRMARLAATYADELNIVSANPDTVRAAYERLDAACEKIGRDPAQVTRSAMTGVLVARDKTELRRRVERLMESLGSPAVDADSWLDERRGRGVLGTPEQAHERVAALHAAGVQRLMLQTFLPRDLDMVGLLGEIFVSG